LNLHELLWRTFALYNPFQTVASCGNFSKSVQASGGLVTSDLSSHDLRLHRKMLMLHDLHELHAKMIL
jgi:hypothetical protein